MTTTSVKDVSTVVNAFTSGMGNTTTAVSGASFQSVWNSQTDAQAASQQPAEDKTPEVKTTNPREEALKAKETVRKEPKEPKEVKNAEAVKAEEVECDAEKVEAAMEMLGSAANEMMQQVADTFGMSVEELKQLMDELNMDTMDILNPGKLAALLLEAGGAQDSMALLTNETLYADFNKLMDSQQQLLADAAEKLQVPKEQIPALLEEVDNLQNAVGEAVEEPVIELSVEGDDASDGQVQNLNKADVQVQQVEAKAETATTGEENQHSENTDNQTGNLLLQNLKAEGTQTVANTATAQTDSVWSADTQNIMRQIMDYMRIQVRPEVSDLEMQLHPANLGTIRIHVSAQSGAVTANFVTENEAVKAALESQMVQLKESFAEQGVKVDAIEVTVQTHQFERNLDQGRGREQGETEKKGRTRRINLNAFEGMEDVEEMTQEEALTAEMMAANGNTVDYTA